MKKKNDKIDPKKNTAVATPPMSKPETKASGAKAKLKIRELTEEEAGEVTGGAGGLAAFCRGD